MWEGSTRMEEHDILKELNLYYPFKFEKIEFLRSGGCVSYIVYTDEAKYLLKIVPKTFADTVKQSVDILLYLVKHDFPVPKLVLTENGMPYWESGTSNGRYRYIIFEYIEGREPEQGEKTEQIGELVGRLHSIMGSYNGNLVVHDKYFFIDRYIDILHQKKYPAYKLREFIEYGDLLWSKIKDLPRGFSHGDLHRGNVLYSSSSELYLLDFDTACNSFPVYDIMVMCDATDYFTFKPEGYDMTTQIFESFLSGYAKYRTLTSAELGTFYDLVAVRHYQLQATIIEIYGLDCVDEAFIDRQLNWLRKWREKCYSGFSLSH